VKEKQRRTEERRANEVKPSRMKVEQQLSWGIGMENTLNFSDFFFIDFSILSTREKSFEKNGKVLS
jgi:hypothetical protein